MKDERALVKDVISGNRQAFKLLIQRYERLVAHMVYRVIPIQEDREEICQDVFIKVYNKLPGFKFDSKLSTWIATIAYRDSLNHLKKKKQVSALDMGENDMQKFESNWVDYETPEHLINRADTKKLVHHFIEKLPLQYKTVLTLFHLEEMSYPEIVEITGMPEGTVKNYLFRGRKLLKDKLKPYLIKEESI